MKKPSPGDVLAQHYRLSRVLGEGSTSIVFSAENLFTDKSVAIKWLLPELMREAEVSSRMLREAQLNATIAHPNVVNVFDVGRHEGSIFLVMELLHGKPLSASLADTPLDPYAFIRLMIPVLRGVQAAHNAGVVHRDLKPDNIFLCVDAHGLACGTKVLDFGVAKLTRSSPLAGPELTPAHTIYGTPHFMAPEQMRDSRDCDERSDIYALGVIFYRALSGAFPFDGHTLSELAVRVAAGNAIALDRRVPQLNHGLSNVVMRALATDPGRRFPSVTDLISALEPYMDGPEASLRALLSLTDLKSRGEPRSLQTEATGQQAAPRLGRRARAHGEAREVAMYQGSGRAPPPPPPRVRPASPQLQEHAHWSALQQLSPFSGALMSDAHPSHASTRPKLALPPPPPPALAKPVEERDSRSSHDSVRWSLLPAVGLVLALCLGWLALRALLADLSP